MSFWSSFNLVRSGPPPIVTAAALGQFIEKLTSIGALSCDEKPSCELKFGSRIDQDEKSTDIMVWSENGYIGIPQDYPWDFKETFSFIPEMCSTLRQDQRTIYRAFISLGSAESSIVQALTREPSEENEVGMCLWSTCFEIGPHFVTSLGSESDLFAGWMKLSFSGNGYFYPWDFRPVRERFEQIELVQNIVSLCKSTWPIAPQKATTRMINDRKQNSELWLYEDLKLSPDWHWYASED